MQDHDNPWVVWERNFIEQMVRLRESRQMTQTELARDLKYYGLPFHQQTIQRIESGDRPVRLNEAHLIAKVLNVDLETMTSAGTPPDREMRYAVGRLRRGSESAAEELSNTLAEWLSDVESFALILVERLKAERDDQADDVANWGLAWASKVISAYYRLSDAWNALGGIHGRPTQISSEDEWEMALPAEDVIEALSSLCGQYMNPKVRNWAAASPRELWALFPGEHDDDDDDEDEKSQDGPRKLGSIVNDEEFLASVRNGFRAPGGPRADIDDLQGFTPKERMRLTGILASRYSAGDPLTSLSNESNLLPVTILDLFIKAGVDLRSEDISTFRDFVLDSIGGDARWLSMAAGTSPSRARTRTASPYLHARRAEPWPV